MWLVNDRVDWRDLIYAELLRIKGWFCALVWLFHALLEDRYSTNSDQLYLTCSCAVYNVIIICYAVGRPTDRVAYVITVDYPLTLDKTG